MNANPFLRFRKFGLFTLCSFGMLAWAASAFAGGWVEFSSPTTSLLLGVDCGAAQSCAAVGVGGTIIHTTDAKTWTVASSGTTSNLWEVDFFGSLGFAVGDSGTLLKSNDYGATWTSITGVTTEGLFGVSVVSSSVAYIAGQNGATFKTTDAGATWTSLASGLSSFDAYAIDAYSATVAYVVGAAGGAYKTTNGGTTWTALSTGTTSALYAVDAVTATTVFMAGENRSLVKTTNGSAFSTLSLSSFGTTETVFDIACSTSSLCLTVGSSGSVMSSGDGGSTWTAETVPGGNDLGGLANVAVGRRYVVGASGAIITLDNYGPSAVGSLALATGGTSTTDTTPEFTWTDATDNESSVASYAIDVDSSGTYTTMGDVNSYALTSALSAGSHTVTVIGVDAAGNNGTASSLTFTVTASSADTTAPTVSSIAPTSITVGVETGITVTYSDNVAVTSCTLFDGGIPFAMTLGSGTATYSTTFDSAGSHSMYVLCGDAAGNTGTGATTTVTIVSSGADTTAPVVGALTPSTATAGTATSLSVSYTEAVGISSCYLYVGGVSQGAMTVTPSASTAARSYTPSAAGTLSAYAVCTDTSGNIGTGTTTSITVSAASTDTTAPTVGSFSPLTAVADAATTFSVSYSDAVGVTSCTAHIGSNTSAMALSSGTASVSQTLTSSGSYSAYATCVDAAGNTGTGTAVTIVVSAASTDTTGPTVGSVSPATATQNSPVTFSVTATDASGIYGCYLMVDGNAQGSMTASSSTYTRSYTPALSGRLSVYVWCGDAVGNIGTGSTTTVTVAAAAATATDAVPPTVGAITPLTATENTAVTLYASVADAGGMGTCTLYVNSTNIGSMTISGGYATRSYTFSDAGSAVANAYCVDAAGNATRGASSTITIAAAVSIEEGIAVSEADTDTLLKMACGAVADAEDPCHAVYYYADDGKRHAFPNEKVFYTWYDNFDDVIVVTGDFLASITLGYNVTYHPGTTMVKFVSVNTVYAVGESGELRAVASEDVAKSIWGSNWNTQIDDISDAFFGNYSFGEEINSTSDFDPDAVEASVTNITEILR